VEALITLLRSLGKLDRTLKGHLERLLRRTTHKKGDLLVRPDEIARRIYFIEKGLIRGYRIKGNNERTYYFVMEGDVFISVRSFLTQKVAKEYCECMEDCILHSISFEELESTYRKYIRFNLQRAELLQKYYLLSMEREDMHQLPAFDRYCFLMENQSALVGRIAGKYLASYLNMAKSTFSRNKRKFAKASKERTKRC
jgi:CRP-like cAMP-binding protein